MSLSRKDNKQPFPSAPDALNSSEQSEVSRWPPASIFRRGHELYENKTRFKTGPRCFQFLKKQTPGTVVLPWFFLYTSSRAKPALPFTPLCLFAPISAAYAEVCRSLSLPRPYYSNAEGNFPPPFLEAIKTGGRASKKGNSFQAQCMLPR